MGMLWRGCTTQLKGKDIIPVLPALVVKALPSAQHANKLMIECA